MEPFDIQSSNLHFWGWHENFFSQMRNFEVEIPIWKKKIKKTAPFFLRMEAEFFFSPCYHARHLQQIHLFKIFCRMYCLVLMLTIPRSSPMSLINKIIFLGVFNCPNGNQKMEIVSNHLKSCVKLNGQLLWFGYFYSCLPLCWVQKKRSNWCIPKK